MNCPLCKDADTVYFFREDQGLYHRCQTCYYLFLDKKHYLSAEEEKSIYDLHENNPEDKSYRKFLGRLLGPLGGFLKQQSKGLDYGCGPGPAISAIMDEKDHQVVNYDHFYFNDRHLLDDKYDFITMTEVIEHLQDPLNVLELLKSLLVKDGVLGIMTKIYTEEMDFKNWYYRKDPTHIGFYSTRTLNWLEDYFQLEKIYSDNDNVIIFRSL